uniref:Uncharacterized protein n=1 Tax=Oryza rufipogon TaxID=4529 RepID=A0A0E0N0E4_ORYRU
MNREVKTGEKLPSNSQSLNLLNGHVPMIHLKTIDQGSPRKRKKNRKKDDLEGAKDCKIDRKVTYTYR